MRDARALSMLTPNRKGWLQELPTPSLLVLCPKTGKFCGSLASSTGWRDAFCQQRAPQLRAAHPCPQWPSQMDSPVAKQSTARFSRASLVQ